MADPYGRHLQPAHPADEPLKLECQEFLRLVAGEGDRVKVARDGARVVRALDMLTTSLMAAEVHPTATVYPGTVLGDGVTVLEHAVVGKQPALVAPLDGEARAASADESATARSSRPAPSSSPARRSALACILGDQSCVRSA